MVGAFRLPVDSLERRARGHSTPCTAHTTITCTRESREHRSRRSMYGADKIGRRGRTPTVVPQAYRSRCRWEKNSAVNKMVLTLDTERGARRGDRLRFGLTLSLSLSLAPRARRRDRAAPSLLPSHLSSPSHPFNMADFPHPPSISSSSPPLYSRRWKTFLPPSASSSYSSSSAPRACTFRVFV